MYASEPVSFQYCCDLCAAFDPAKPTSIDAVRLRVVLSTDSLLSLAALSQVLPYQAPTTDGPYASDSLNANHARPLSFGDLEHNQ